jgi:hypothetical protein
VARGDVGVALGVVRHELPWGGRRDVAQDRAVAAGLDGGEEAPAHGQSGVADGVHTAMDPRGSSRARAPRDAVVVEAALAELRR